MGAPQIDYRNVPGAHHVSTDLPTDRCWRLLMDHKTGRFGFLNGEDIEIYPVNYAVHRKMIYFRTASNGAIERAMPQEHVSFQIDGMHPARMAGWSVLVRGRAERVLDPGLLTELFRLPMDEPWAGGLRIAFIAMHPSAVTGRDVHMEI